MFNLFILMISIIIDIIWGELPTAIHPVVWMGKAIDHLSSFLLKWNSRLSGLVLTLIILLTFMIIFYLMLLMATFSWLMFILVSSVLLSSTFAIKGLYQTASAVKNVLDENVDEARELVSYLVSRDTKNLSKNGLVSATVESLTENINDSVIGPLFFILLAGMVVNAVYGADFTFTQITANSLSNFKWLAGVKNPLSISWYSFSLLILPILVGVFYRVINTLDAMVGYNNLKYRMIGWVPAKIDDIINFIPSRITGIMVVIAAGIIGLDWKNSWIIMKRDAKKTPSPNSGFPMAATAGALNVQLEKPSIYVLGESGTQLDTEIIGKAILLTKITILLFFIISFTIYIIINLTITTI
jgi:adenosylcobinamide-phosphate synthase